MLEEYVTVMSDHMMVVNTRPLDYCIYLDPATDRELVFRHGVITEARKVSPSRTQRSVDFTLQGKAGFNFQNFSAEEYKAFCEEWERRQNG